MLNFLSYLCVRYTYFASVASWLTKYFIANLLHRYFTTLQIFHLLQEKYPEKIAVSVANFFTDKISKLRISLTSNISTSSQHSPSPSTNNTSQFSLYFRLTSESEISKILFNCANKQSDSDPIPILTWLLKVCASVLTPTITNIVSHLTTLELI